MVVLKEILFILKWRKQFFFFFCISVASPAQATAAERVVPHQYSHASPVSTPNSLSRHDRRTRHTPVSVHSNNIDQHIHGMKSQELVQNVSEEVVNKTSHHGPSVLPEPVIVLENIGDQMNSNISRLPLPPNISSPTRNSDSSHKSKAQGNVGKNEPVVRLEMLDPSVSTFHSELWQLTYFAFMYFCDHRIILLQPRASSNFALAAWFSSTTGCAGLFYLALLKSGSGEL